MSQPTADELRAELERRRLRAELERRRSAQAQPAAAPSSDFAASDAQVISPERSRELASQMPGKQIIEGVRPNLPSPPPLQMQVDETGRGSLSIIPGITTEVGGGRRPAATMQGPSFFEALGQTGPDAAGAAAAGALRMGARAGFDTLRGVSGFAEDLLFPNASLEREGFDPIRPISSRLPTVETSPGEAAVAAGVQYGLPGGYGAMGAERLTRSAVQALPRTMQGISRGIAMALGAFGTDAVVTDPENAVTFGDVIGPDFPTAIRETDSAWARRLKVGFEGMAATLAVAPIMEGIAGGARAVHAIASVRENAERQVRESFVDALRRGQSRVSDTPVDDAREALRELVDAQRVFQADGLEAVPEHMRPFVANNIQVTPGEYLSARGLNLGGVEVYRARSSDPRVVERRQETAETLQRATSEATGDVGIPTDPLRGAAERRVSQAADEAAQTRADFGEEAQRLFDDVSRETRRQRELAEETATEISQTLRSADELRAAGRVDEAVRLERRAAMDIRDALYRAVDPDGTVRVTPNILNEEVARFRADGGDFAIQDVPGMARLIDRINKTAQQPNLSFRDVQALQREFSRVSEAIASNRAYGAYAEDFASFRKGVFERYAAQVAEQGTGAEEVLRLANSFMREDFAPRFREFAGEAVDNMLRRRATGSAEVTGEFIGRGATAMEDAGQLNRILMGTRLDPADVRVVMDRFNAGETVGVGRFETRSVDEYRQSIQDVTEVLLARLGRQTNFDPNPRQVDRFLNQYNFALEGFPAEVRTAIQQLREQAETREGRAQLAQALETAQQCLRPYAGDISRINPDNAVQRISDIAESLRTSNMTPDAAVNAARRMQQASAREREVAAEPFVRLFGGRSPKDAIAAAFRQQDPAQAIRQALDQIGRTDENMAMIRQATADYLLENVARVPRGDASPETVRQVLSRLNGALSNSTTRSALSEVYGPDGLRAMEIIQDQIRNAGHLNTSINSGALAAGTTRDVRRQLQEAMVEAAGAGLTGPGGLSQRTRQRSIIQLVNRVQGLVGGEKLDDVIARRMTDIALDPRAALAVLEPMSEARANLMAMTLINEGRAAMLALREYLGPEQAPEPEETEASEAMPTGFMRSGGRSF